MDREQISHYRILEKLGAGGMGNGDTAAARKSYQDFFALWRDADPDLPVLMQARKEYEALR